MSITELLDFIDPDAVPVHIQQLLREFGPALARDETLLSIAERNGRSKEWAASCVTEIRRAFLDQAQDYLGEMSPSLRERVIDELERLSPPPTRRAVRLR